MSPCSGVVVLLLVGRSYEMCVGTGYISSTILLPETQLCANYCDETLARRARKEASSH
jgi:hypothetical protein